MKQLLIIKTPFTEKYFATRAYKELDDGRIMVTGKKEDVTEQIEGIVEEQYEDLKEENERLREALSTFVSYFERDMGELSLPQIDMVNNAEQALNECDKGGENQHSLESEVRQSKTTEND